MRKTLGSIAATALLLAGSTAQAAAPSEPGTISVEPVAIEPGLGPSAPTFVEAVAKALTDREFTILSDTGHGRFVADLKLTRVETGTTRAKVAVAGASAEAGGSPSMAGGGVKIALPTGKTRTAALQQTQLEVRIRKRGEQTVLWQGSAMTVRPADAAHGQDGAVASALTEAIFRSYPAQSESVASVP